MSFTDKKLEIAIFTLVAVLIGGLGYLFKAPVQHALGNSDVTYEMPRPKSFLATLFGLGLEDREITRKYVNPFDKKKEEAKKAADAKAPAAPAAKVAQKKADAKKAADAAKKPSVEMTVVGQDTPGLSADDISGGAGGGYSRVNANPNTQAQQDKGTAKDNGLSSDQWRALISGQPTKENVAKLIASYQSKDVDDSTFYTIVSDLLRNNKSETQALGLYAASSVYSAQSFAVVAANYDQLTGDNQTAAHSYLMSYASSSRSTLLMAALKSSNPVVVDLAAQVVIKGYQDAKSGVATASDPRSSRGDVNTQSNAVADYSKFVPVFQQLAQSSDPTIASVAHSALSEIQTGVAAL